MTTLNEQAQNSFRQDFISFAIEKDVLRFGEFKTKAGRMSPYFFNAGLFDDGESIMKLGEYYAQAITEAGIAFDMLFGPAYKGITLAASIAIAFARQGRNVPYAYNRKEAKDHGEGGLLVGAPLTGKVLIIDDVITAGTAVREVIDIINSANAKPAAVLIGLNRQERGNGELSAIQEVEQEYNIPVISIIDLDDIIHYMSTQGQVKNVDAMQRYRDQYGV